MKKNKKRIYEENGRWLLETTQPNGRVTATYCTSKESAEHLLRLGEEYHGKKVEFQLGYSRVIGRISNTGIIYKNGEKAPGTDVLYIRYEKSTYLRPAADCKILEV